MAAITALFRYPVKGLSPDPLDHVALQTGRGFPADRQYALTTGAMKFDPADATPWPKTRFIVLAQYAALAKLRTRYLDDAAQTFTVSRDGTELWRGSLLEAKARASLAAFMADKAGMSLPGQPEFAARPDWQFTDVSVTSATYMRAVSLNNLASVRDFSKLVGRDVEAIRFRGNIYFDGGPAWEEFEWLDRDIAIGPVRARVLKRIKRCPATEVNPNSAERDFDVPRELIRQYRHADMGIYAEILTPGEIRPGDEVKLL